MFSFEIYYVLIEDTFSYCRLLKSFSYARDTNKSWIIGREHIEFKFSTPNFVSLITEH